MRIVFCLSGLILFVIWGIGFYLMSAPPLNHVLLLLSILMTSYGLLGDNSPSNSV